MSIDMDKDILKANENTTVNENTVEEKAEVVSEEKATVQNTPVTSKTSPTVTISSDIYIDEAEIEKESKDIDEEDYSHLFNPNTQLWKNDIVLDQRNEVSEVQLTDEQINMFYGSEDYEKVNTEVDNSSIMNMLTSFRKMGQHLDVYLPMSNVVVRMYEFENDIVIPEITTLITEDELLAFQTGRRDITPDRLFLQKIFQNSEILSKGAESSEFDMERLSNLDMNYLILGAAKLLLLSEPTLKGEEKHTIRMGTNDEIVCSECGTRMDLLVDIDKILISQYKKDQVEFAKTHYNPDATFLENFNASYHIQSRRKGAQYTKDGFNQIVVTCCDPSYIDALSKDTACLRYLVRQYEKIDLVSDLIVTAEYKSSSIKNKFNSLVESIRNHPYGFRYMSRINTDMSIMMKIRYIDSIFSRFKENENGKDVWKIKEKLEAATTPMEQLFALYKNFPTELKDKISTIIEDLNKKAIDNVIRYDFKCIHKDCGHINTLELDARSLVFSTIQSQQQKLGRIE